MRGVHHRIHDFFVAYATEGLAVRADRAIAGDGVQAPDAQPDAYPAGYDRASDPAARGVAALADKILQTIDKEPLYYTDIAERFGAYDFRTVASALGHLHASEKLWQDSRGRMCVRGSQFAAKPPVK